MHPLLSLPLSINSFVKVDGKWDIQVKGLGLDFMVGEASNTLLKAPKVGKHIPTVAERTQGEVVHFAAEATRRMGEDGLVVLLEGRQQTVDYVPTRMRSSLSPSFFFSWGVQEGIILCSHLYFR